MKYKVGDRVRIKSLDWYNENKDQHGRVACGYHVFTEEMSKFCGYTMIVCNRTNLGVMAMGGSASYWTDEMIEGLVEEEIKPEPKFKVGDKIKLKSTLLNDVFGVIGYEPEGYRITNISNGLTYFMSYSIEHYYELVEEEVGLVDNLSSRWVNEFNLPEGYIFKDENGNVINATKIVLEKKKEYPKTFLGCCDVLGIEDTISRGVKGYKSNLLDTFQKLLICRDAYWKIAGDEMGLGKPWEPDYDSLKTKYTIEVIENKVVVISTISENHILAFPTEEMRDAFYENFKELIENCKELL